MLLKHKFTNDSLVIRLMEFYDLNAYILYKGIFLNKKVLKDIYIHKNT